MMIICPVCEEQRNCVWAKVMDFYVLLKLMVDKSASDLFVTTGLAPSNKVNGTITSVGSTPLSPEKVRQVVESIMDEEQIKDFRRNKELSFAIGRLGSVVFESVLFISAMKRAWYCAVLRPLFQPQKTCCYRLFSTSWS
ncbi:MAG: Tfp pilus assembly ATPase PilU [Porticoccus sp.]|jgi:Tfp pilus assembly ATPase PilU